MSKGKANPQNIRDLRLMYDTEGFFDGVIDSGTVSIQLWKD